MGTHEKIRFTRRKLIQAMGWLALLPLAGIWDLMVKRDQAGDKGRSFRILIIDIPEGNSDYGEFGIRRKGAMIKVFSSRCTHLGCRVKAAGDGRMICPCHGSAFDAETGAILKGPAARPLEMLNFTVEQEYLTIIIK
jgi:Rieske Fe-S protein